MGQLYFKVDRVETLRDVQTWHAAATETELGGFFLAETGGFIIHPPKSGFSMFLHMFFVKFNGVGIK